MTRAVGGFLELRLPAAAASPSTVWSRWVGSEATAWTLQNARSALNALWTVYRPARIFLPAYICVEVAEAVPNGIPIHYYEVDERLHPIVHVLAHRLRSGDHVLAVDYFGRCPSDEFLALARSRSDIGWIEDRAQALDPGPEWGTWQLYSPRKLLGVPDGGILVASSRADPLDALPTKAPEDFAFVLPYLARAEDPCETDNARWYEMYVRAEDRMATGRVRMTEMTTAALKTIDAAADGAIRRTNYRVLHSRLRDWAFIPDDQITFAPLGFPVRVPSASALANHLRQHRVFAARHWQALPSPPSEHPVAHRLADELLTLPCDYRYSPADMHEVAEEVLRGLAP